MAVVKPGVLALTIVAPVGFMSAGCSNGTGGSARSADAGGFGSGFTASDADLPLECPQQGATLSSCDTYAAGLEKVGQQAVFKVRLLDASAQPPSKGTNVWTIQVMDAAGAAIDGATFDWTDSPWMPCHQHGSSIVPAATQVGMDGTYKVDRLNFFMPGIWRTTFNLTSSDARRDRVMFQFYIAR